VIAETLHLRRDLPIVDMATDLTRELALLTAHGSDLIADRVRMINRFRDVMTSVFPTLEQQFDYSSHKGALILLTEYASPKRLRRLGETRLTNGCAAGRCETPPASPPGLWPPPTVKTSNCRASKWRR
jgi:hypothetical protein